jgi:hypothetical protein
MSEDKHIERVEQEQGEAEFRSLTAAAIAGAAGGTASAVANQALAKLGSIGKQAPESEQKPEGEQKPESK